MGLGARILRHRRIAHQNLIRRQANAIARHNRHRNVERVKRLLAAIKIVNFINKHYKYQ